jgi:DNA-binding beta-propeller fold protein YncE
MKVVQRGPAAWLCLVAGILAGQPGVLAAQDHVVAGYHLIKSVPLPGDGKGDFITMDAKSRRLYVTHGDTVQVLDADSLKLIGTVDGTPHSHGVLGLEKLGKGYATSGDPGSVVVFDLKSFKHIAEIPSQPDTDVILYDAPSGRVFTFNGDSHDATVIDPTTDKVLKILDLGGDPEVAVSDGEGKLFDNLESKSEVIRIDSKSLEIEQHWPVAPGDTPSGLAMDRKHHRLFIGCRNKLMVVMDSTNGKVIQSLPIGDHIDTTAFDPRTGTIFDSCGDGTLSVIHQDSPEKYSVVENVATEAGAKTMAYDPKTGRVFSSTAKTAPAPPPTTDDPKPNGKVLPGTFHLLVLSK